MVDHDLGRKGTSPVAVTAIRSAIDDGKARYVTGRGQAPINSLWYPGKWANRLSHVSRRPHFQNRMLGQLARATQHI
jgi:hypothetical protein